MLAREGAPPTLPSLIRAAVAPQWESVCLSERTGGGWVGMTGEQLLRRSEAVGRALSERCEPGDRVALVADNSADWIVAHFGILFARCVSVPIFPDQTVAYQRDILRECMPRLAFVDSGCVRRIRMAASLSIVEFGGTDESSFTAFEARGAIAPALDDRGSTTSSDLAVIAYTAGTTGPPKGAMLSHNNLIRNALDSFTYAFSNVRAGEPVLAVLPFSHMYQHTLIYGYLNGRTPIYVCRDSSHLRTDVRSVRPAVVAVVPRILDAIVAEMKPRGGEPKASLLRSLGLDRLRFFACGSSPLDLDTALTLKGAGIEVLEGYGLTECSPLVSVNVLSSNRLGTVGKPIPRVEVRIAEDGEILVRGPNVMLGYYRDPSATAAAFTPDGWLRTGDVGSLDSEGYLRVTDRKRDLIKTSGGDFVAPAPIEIAIRRSLFVRDVVVLGEGRPHVIALVAPDWQLLRTMFEVDERVPIDMLEGRSDVRTFIAREVRCRTADRPPHERIERIAIVPDGFTTQGGELSPTMKVRRTAVQSKYRQLIDAAYQS